ncbi:aspartyl-phosphate phosphatase Spo0E family protein [Ureibacillus aquaedulcis]|uniref:Aspartyl-phosphate phosphatase Spo0E family protein n=1 Tax=Ureibacillus aquaedulcis TaxID=3058421 RepID=A0ABT8GW26_9BACL|nr:aspartyl-phosphate phosphatase Spo0E family protein [Ureibacillus sp. BA0131]MDN4495615.1 aspartyl-phosphate phosphatase Spo0E family protein [Ureibacillus sp. BA0131]
MSKETMSLLDLENAIVTLQSRMIDIGLSKGLTHPETVKCSQELDIVLNHFQKLNSKQNAYVGVN